jgi:hypothetical protein
MNAGTKLAALNKFRNSNSAVMRQPATKVLVVYDVQVKPPEVSHIPLIVNYGGPCLPCLHAADFDTLHEQIFPKPSKNMPIGQVSSSHPLQKPFNA